MSIEVQQVLDHAERQCSEHGVRLTDKRKQVLSSLVKSGKALSAYELVDYCNQEFGTNIPAMSVYRILEFLQQENLVHKLLSENKYIACSHITCGHEHRVPQFLICSRCSKVKEISVQPELIESLRQSVEQADYHLQTQQLELNCLCEDCVTEQ